MKKSYTYKKKKQNRKIVLLPIVILFIVTAILSVTIIVMNKASALTSNLEITSKYKCGSDSSHTVAITKDYVELSSSMHAKKVYCQDCSYTTYVESEKHDSASEGHQPNSCMDPYIRCTKCGYKIEKASDSTIESLHQYLNVANNWVSISDTQHEQQYTCTVCHVTVSKNKGSHDSNVAPNSCMNPYYLCSKCGKQMKKASDTEIEALHKYVNGVCTVCKKQQTTHTHTWGYHPQGNTGKHTKACTGCSAVTTETCSPNSSKVISAATCVDAAVVELTCSQCGGTWQTTGAAATGKHKYVNGICSVCGAKDPSYTETCTHPSASRKNTYSKSDINQHKITITCSLCNTVLSTTYEEHSGSTHSNFGYCTKCGELYDPHGSDNRNLKRYETSESGHIKVYPCTGKDCSVEFKSTKEAHTFENGICSVCDYECIHSWNGTRTCTNDVKCTKCGKILLAYGHDYPSTPSRYTKDSSKHTPIYVCSKCGNEKTGAASNHTGGTHNNGGKCTVCSQIYQNHGKGTTVANYNKTATQHTPIYKCTYSGCNQTYNGVATNHTGGTHSNGGKCTVCSQIYQNHGKGTTVANYNKTATQHTPIYKCTYSGCNETYSGTAVNHNISKWTDNKNGTHSGLCTICNYNATNSHTYRNSICTLCGAKESSDSPSCTHTYEMRNNETIHWEECTKCNYIKQNSIEDHNVSKWNSDGSETHSGKCTKCNYNVKGSHIYNNNICTLCGAKKQSEPIDCQHVYERRSNENEHWEECIKCGNEKNGTRANHNITTWTDTGDGKHKGICTECNYEVKKAHTYSNGKCSSCGAKEPTTTPENCTHNYEIKSDETGHWEKCTKCQKETVKSAHNITTWTDKKDGNHEGICTVCKKTITEAHTNGTSGKCTKCSYDGTSSGNNSGNGNNNNSNNGNNNNGGNNSNNGNNSGTNGKDNTTANGKIPQTGTTPIFITIATITVGIAGFAVYKMKKLKDVK